MAGHHLNGVHLANADEFVPDAVHELPVGGLISHQFFRPYAVTFDFDGMRLFLAEPR